MERLNDTQELMVLPVFDTVILPHMTSKMLVDYDTGKMLGIQMKTDAPFALATTVKKSTGRHTLSEDDFYRTGALIRLDSIQHTDKGDLIFFASLKKVNLELVSFKDEHFFSTYSFVNVESDLNETDQQSMLNFIMKTIRDISHNFKGAEQFVSQVEQFKSVDEVIGFSLPFMNVTDVEKLELLEVDSEKQKGLRFIDLLTKQKDSIELQIEMAQKFNKKINKNHREALLREQLKAIQDELDETEKKTRKDKDYRELIEEAGMPEEVHEIALTELDKLEKLGPQNHESGMLRNYLDLLTALPWKSGEAKPIDLDNARKILDDQHFGLKDVKERIIQHLAVMALRKDKKGSILLLVGPPGTGKTSLGKSIAEVLDRKYVRLSLGGIRDEAEIRGHRRTYIGALPGRIIQGMKRAGQKNPVFVLDEVDKLLAAYSGDPASALLEVLDPEQNNTFSDHYLEVPYDLSEVFFVATANSVNTIPGPLLDRMEVIRISSYTNKEKFVIGRRHLMPLILEEHGLTEAQLEVDDESMFHIIEKYTREAGVRGLKKQLSKIARTASEKIVSGSTDLPYRVNRDKLSDILGKPVVRLDDAPASFGPGVVTGLAWTQTGGEILFIEGTTMPGRGELILTGQLGDVMKESAKISMSLIRSRLAHMISQFDFRKNDIHIHIPSGAIPKDGPSAGITLFTALASLLLGQSVNSKLAMTGEITLRGSVMPVGGIKEKLLAAHRAGIKTIVLSRENEIDLKDIPDEVKDQLTFVFVETIEEVIRETLGVTLPLPGILPEIQENTTPVSGSDVL